MKKKKEENREVIHDINQTLIDCWKLIKQAHEKKKKKKNDKTIRKI